MYDIRQFRPTLYLVVALGLTGFCIADNALGLWVISMLAMALNIWLLRSRSFVAMPRLLANLVTLGVVAYVVRGLVMGGEAPLHYIGQFLLFLQVIKLFERQANRDYAQLLVLSLLLMVAGCLLTASFAFGIVLGVHLVLALYGCLLFHLKVETDRARQALAIPEDRISPSTLRQDQRFLGRSMRRLTGLVSVVSVAAAVVTFVFFPRGAGQGVLGQIPMRPAAALTGFSDRVSFEQINRIRQSDEVVARVFVWKDGKPVLGTESLFLRGFTLDQYGSDTSRATHRPQWSRHAMRNVRPAEIPDDLPVSGQQLPPGEVWRQRIALHPTGTHYLFALPSLISFKDGYAELLAIRANRRASMRYAQPDQSITIEALQAPIEYEVLSVNAPQPLWGGIPAIKSDSTILEQIKAYTLRDDVGGELARNRRDEPLQEDDEIIARRIEQHLRTQFAYTLDLTDSGRALRSMDPVVAFLTQVRKGHCEYFASAMTLMCQSIGIRARIVVGFRCDGGDYSPLGGYYIVRQANAHTWVEVLTPQGWMTFDPTSGRDARTTQTASVWQSIWQFVDYLQFKWGQSVIAYDMRDQSNLLDRLDASLSRAITAAAEWFTILESRLRGLTDRSTFWAAYAGVLIALMATLIGAIVLAITWYTVQRYRLKRRAARIGLEGLPRGQRMRLARQLAFYDQLTQTLHRRGIVREEHQTPMEFANSLVFLPGEVYTTILRLTSILYRVRFGQTELSSARRRHLYAVVHRIGQSIDGARDAGMFAIPRSADR